MAVGGLEKAISSVSHPSSNPLAKPATNIPTHSHESHTQTHSEETLIAKRGGKQLTRRAGANLEQYFSVRRQAGLCTLWMQSMPGATGPLVSTPPRRHPTGGEALGSRSNAHCCRGHGTPHVTKNQHRPRATFPCEVLSPAPAEEMSPPEGQPSAGVTYLFPTHAAPLPSFTSCMFAVFCVPGSPQTPRSPFVTHEHVGQKER